MSFTVESLPALNASLNATAFTLLLGGFVSIKRRAVGAHRAFMLSALAVSVTFLTSYIIYHASHGATRFPGRGAARVAYLTLLASHTLLAMSLVALVPLTLARALAGRIELHRKVARVTLPIWMYVSVTGVAVYWMLYRAFGPA